MKVLCCCFVLLTVAFVINGESCSISDLIFTMDSYTKYALLGHIHGNEPLKTKSAYLCRKACQDYDKRISDCTHYMWFGLGSNHCYLYNGPMEMEYYNSNTSPKTFACGVAYCEDEKRSIQQKATARWERVITCHNPSSDPMSCSYKKTVGVLRRTSSSTSETKSQSAAATLGMTLGMEAGDPLGAAKVSMTSSMSVTQTVGYDWTAANSATFQESSTESVSAGAPQVPSGRTISICQAVGSIGDFVLHSTFFRKVNGDNCNESGSEIGSLCDASEDDWACCTSSSPCGLGEGDCDKDSDCARGLVCGSDNCKKSFDSAWSHSTFDCCTNKGQAIFTKCTASNNQANYNCKEAFDGITNEVGNGWAYSGKVPAWAEFYLAKKTDINQIILTSGQGRNDCRLRKFRVTVKSNGKWPKLSDHNLKIREDGNARITSDGYVTLASGIHVIHLDFDAIPNVEKIHIRVTETDAANQNLVLNEIVALSTSTNRNDGATDITEDQNMNDEDFFNDRTNEAPEIIEDQNMNDEDFVKDRSNEAAEIIEDQNVNDEDFVKDRSNEAPEAIEDENMIKEDMVNEILKELEAMEEYYEIVKGNKTTPKK